MKTIDDKTMELLKVIHDNFMEVLASHNGNRNNANIAVIFGQQTVFCWLLGHDNCMFEGRNPAESSTIKPMLEIAQQLLEMKV